MPVQWPEVRRIRGSATAGRGAMIAADEQAERATLASRLVVPAAGLGDASA